MITERKPEMSPMLFHSIESMLAPKALTDLIGVQVTHIEREPYVVAHRSANELYQIHLHTLAGRQRLILKEFQPRRDWVMRLTHDTLTREVMLYAHGIYAQMPPEIVVPIIAVAHHGDTWASLMRDVASDLIPLNTMQSETNTRLLLSHLATIHAHFWTAPALENPALGLSSLADFLTVLAPARVRAEIDAGRSDPVLELAARGWHAFEASAPADVVKTIRDFQNNPERLISELDWLPKTLVHGDYKLPNLGLDGRDRAIVLDWQDAASGLGVLDLGYFLALNARWLPFDLTTLVEIYAEALSRQGHSLSSDTIDLGLVAGGALRLLWLMVLNNQNDLKWWYDLIRHCSAI